MLIICFCKKVEEYHSRVLLMKKNTNTVKSNVLGHQLKPRIEVIDVREVLWTLVWKAARNLSSVWRSVEWKEPKSFSFGCSIAQKTIRPRTTQDSTQRPNPQSTSHKKSKHPPFSVENLVCGECLVCNSLQNTEFKYKVILRCCWHVQCCVHSMHIIYSPTSFLWGFSFATEK